MRRVKIVGVSGSPRRPSRTTALVEAVAAEVTSLCPADVAVYDVAGLGRGIDVSCRAELPEAALAALRDIEAADALIVGTPIYKGSYAGLFKHLFDFVDPATLAGRPVALTATGGGRRHALAVEHQLRPLFGFFSALTLPTAVYASDEDVLRGRINDTVTLGRVRQVARELVELTTARAPALSSNIPQLDRVA